LAVEVLGTLTSVCAMYPTHPALLTPTVSGVSVNWCSAATACVKQCTLYVLLQTGE